MLPVLKVSKGAKIRNRYNQVPHLTQDTNETILLDIKTHVKTDGKENIYKFTTRNYV